MRCTACGEDNPDGFRWCGFCGSALTAAPAAPGRKVVTLAFAARVEQAAAAGEVLMGEATLRVVRDAVVVEEIEALALKGKSESVAAWRLLEVTGRAGVLRRLDAPLVGRTRELERLVAAWRATVDESGARLVT